MKFVALCLIVFAFGCDNIVTPEARQLCIKAAEEKARNAFLEKCGDTLYKDCVEGPNIEKRYIEEVNRCLE